MVKLSRLAAPLLALALLPGLSACTRASTSPQPPVTATASSTSVSVTPSPTAPQETEYTINGFKVKVPVTLEDDGQDDITASFTRPLPSGAEDMVQVSMGSKEDAPKGLEAEMEALKQALQEQGGTVQDTTPIPPESIEGLTGYRVTATMRDYQVRAVFLGNTRGDVAIIALLQDPHSTPADEASATPDYDKLASNVRGALK